MFELYLLGLAVTFLLFDGMCRHDYFVPYQGRVNLSCIFATVMCFIWPIWWFFALLVYVLQQKGKRQ